jgi:hypothetical protein
MENYPRSDRWRGWRITSRTIPALAVGCIVALALIVSACGGGTTSNAAQGTAHASPVATGSAVSPSPSADAAPPATSGSAPAPPSPTQVLSPSGTAGQGGASQYLAGLNQVAGSGDTFTGSAEVNGQTYAESVSLEVNPGPANVSYDLGRQWGHLQATLGLSDDSPENEKVQFQIIADQRTIYSHVFELGQSQQINLDVTGVLRLELIATEVSPYVGQTEAVWGNAELAQ